MEKEMEIKMSIHDALDTLNPMQREAAVHTEGPLLILAGAGSGKTRVLTHRIAYLIEEKGVNPWNIMAITFAGTGVSSETERRFFTHLVREGIHVKVESNRTY